MPSIVDHKVDIVKRLAAESIVGAAQSSLEELLAVSQEEFGLTAMSREAVMDFGLDLLRKVRGENVLIHLIVPLKVKSGTVLHSTLRKNNDEKVG